MTTSAGAAERNWSSYNYIHSIARNRLQPARANELVFTFSNLQLIEKFHCPEKFADWVREHDEEDDTFTEAEKQDMSEATYCEGPEPAAEEPASSQLSHGASRPLGAGALAAELPSDARTPPLPMT